MNDPEALANELSDVLATETTGLIRHVADAQPHVTWKTYRLSNVLKQLAHESRDHAGRITRLMDRLELDPRARSFSPVVANYHFLNLEAMLPELIAEKQGQIDAYRRAIGHLGDVPDARAELQALLEDNFHQLDQLKNAH